jgi:hypothetical protein
VLGGKERRVSDDPGRVFVLPVDTPLFLVDIAVLTPAPVATWRKTGAFDIPAHAGAGAALTAAKENDYQVVYLAQTIDAGGPYRLMRRWIEARQTKADPFVAGPVLGRGNAGSAAEAVKALGQMVRDLRGRFRGPQMLLTGSPEAVAAVRGLDVKVIFVGAGQVAPEVLQVKTLNDVPELLQRK